MTLSKIWADMVQTKAGILDQRSRSCSDLKHDHHPIQYGQWDKCNCYVLQEVVFKVRCITPDTAEGIGVHWLAITFHTLSTKLTIPVKHAAHFIVDCLRIVSSYLVVRSTGERMLEGTQSIAASNQCLIGQGAVRHTVAEQHRYL